MNRDINLKRIKKLGYSINANLPLINYDNNKLRSADDIIDRLLCLYTVVGVAINDSRELRDVCIKWLKKEELYKKLTSDEIIFFKKNNFSIPEKYYQIESAYKLLWVLHKIERINIKDRIPDNLIQKFPSVNSGSRKDFAKGVKVRDYDEIYWELDFLYLLDWSIVNSKLNGIKVKSNLLDYPVFYRRKALEWVLSDEDWDNIQLDT